MMIECADTVYVLVIMDRDVHARHTPTTGPAAKRCHDADEWCYFFGCTVVVVR